ncbi:macrophage mannose receptor 1-like isoform X2 [Corythoichthys intestinalis]|uniref:macrophage mannose receptor 1-like isoform X2 n=1 Tax=Corythoichthys intestinalis TaxID=161448 RepID=UPI0025A52EE1|nr:macrophage mannose receptor 1-like isoform X2 [Corythoichthys intestinalis]
MAAGNKKYLKKKAGGNATKRLLTANEYKIRNRQNYSQCALCSSARRVFYVVNQTMSQSEALRHCKDKHHNLAAVQDQEDVKTMMNIEDLETILKEEQLAWIGLSTREPRWKWSLLGQTFYRDLNYSKWNPEQPNDTQDRECCVLMDHKGYWHDVKCDQQLPFICNYTLVEKNLTWYDAQSSCQGNKSELATISSEPENHKIKLLLAGRHKAWLGLKRDSWKWSDGSGFAFSHWQNGEPASESDNDVCVVANFSNGAQWKNHNCDSQLPFICYHVVQPMRTLLVSLTMLPKTESVDLNQEALQKRMQDSLQIQQFNVSWKMLENKRKGSHQEKKTNNS